MFGVESLIESAPTGALVVAMLAAVVYVVVWAVRQRPHDHFREVREEERRLPGK